MNKTYGKRVLSLFIVLALVFSLMSGFTVFAADDTLNTSLSFSQETAAPGDTVTVTVSLTNYNSTFAASYPISALQIDVAVDTSLVTVSNVTTLETSGAFGGASAANYNETDAKVTFADIFMSSGAYVALAAATDGVVEIMSFDITVADTAEGEIPFDVVTVANDGTSDAYAANDGTFTLAVGSGEVTPTQYTITVKNPANGTVSVNKTTATAGEVITVTATPNNGFYAKEIKVDGVAISGNTFTVTGNHTVEVKFEKVKYAITVGTVSNGTVTVDKASADLNAKINVTATPDEGYELESILVDGVAITGTSFNVTGNHVVTATFKKTAVETEEYTITVTYGGKGTGSVTIVTSAAAGATVDFTATPTLTSAGLACVCTLISSDDVTIATTTAATGAFTGGSFVMPESDVAITVNFQILGDINLNGGINTTDATMLKRITGGTYTASAEQKIVANVAGTTSAAVNVSDLTVFKRYTGQIISQFPTGTY